MPYSTKLMVTIDVSDPPKWKLPIPLDESVSRDATIFHIVSGDDTISILGTYDQIIEYATDIVAKMYSWPIVAGRKDEWFTEIGDPILSSAMEDSDGTDTRAGSVSSIRGSGDAQGEGAGDDAA